MEEKTATRKIISKISRKSDYELVSSKTQMKQLYFKKDNPNTSSANKNALEYIIAQMESLCSGIQNDPPNTPLVQGELLSKTTLPDREDARHIAIAWLCGCNYFVTIDWKTILNLNGSKMIESALTSIPNFQGHNHSFEVTDARTFASNHFP